MACKTGPFRQESAKVGPATWTSFYAHGYRLLYHEGGMAVDFWDAARGPLLSPEFFFTIKLGGCW